MIYGGPGARARRMRVPNRVVDLRSDTVTQPGEAMRRAMASAEVGDDVYGDDPSVNELERRVAELLGKEIAVFFPSGTQSNLAAILAHCQRGDEMIVGSGYHVFHDEAGGASALGGVSYRTLPVESDGGLEPAAIASAIRPDNPHYPRTALLCIENTVGGKAVPLERMAAAAEAARSHNIAIHLDGARLFNAAAELALPASTLAEVADSVSVCLSKGLGAPAGTMLAASGKLERRIRRNRKILGGAMRQSGILAAAGLHALDCNIDRLPEDHRRAQSLAAALAEIPDACGLEVAQSTNMVFLTPREEDRAALHAHMISQGILTGDRSPTMRLVFHLGIDDEDLRRTGEAITGFYATQSAGG